ncbi:uncharacterized protein LOC134816504 isoform X2 [Bolinopsis microptera]|uniref:uncharacterized protein LOC134816504 isoform X2 n=1 Tax=Bolinopsis microptera TaxID=2820187 RepID=UPI00307AD838
MRSLVTFAAILVAVTADSRIWEKHRGKVLRGKYSSGVSEYNYLEEAQIECMMRSDCGGITYIKSSQKYSLRSGVNLVDAPKGKKATSWLLMIPIRETEFETDLAEGRVMSCSGKEINEMGCSCLADLYNVNGCASNLSYDTGSCVTYNHHCKQLKDGKKKEKTCCRAIMCYINKYNC